MAPFAPHFAEELWQAIDQPYSVFNATWPGHDESKLVQAVIQLGVQINGKIRGQIEVAAEASDQIIIAETLKDPKIKSYIEGKTVIKSFVVPKKLVSLVIK